MKLRAPSPSMAVSIFALVVATSGTSYAVATIGSGDIRNDSVRSKDIRDDTVRSKDVRDNSLRKRDFRGGLPAGAQGPAGPAGADGVGRWLLVDASGAIIAQSGGFTIRAAYQTLPNTAPAPGDNSARAAGNVYIDAGEDLSDNGIVASVALQNSTDQNGDGITNGRAPGADANPEFSGEVSVSQCGLTGITACAPPGANNLNHFVVSPRNSDGTVTSDGQRKRFYVIVTD